MSAGLADVGRLRPLWPLGALVLNLLAFREAAETFRLDRGGVDEHGLAAAVGRDETESLRIVEPLHRTCRHRTLLAANCRHPHHGHSRRTPRRSQALFVNSRSPNWQQAIAHIRAAVERGMTFLDQRAGVRPLAGGPSAHRVIQGLTSPLGP